MKLYASFIACFSLFLSQLIKNPLQSSSPEIIHFLYYYIFNSISHLYHPENPILLLPITSQPHPHLQGLLHNWPLPIAHPPPSPLHSFRDSHILRHPLMVLPSHCWPHHHLPIFRSFCLPITPGFGFNFQLQVWFWGHPLLLLLANNIFLNLLSLFSSSYSHTFKSLFCHSTPTSFSSLFALKFHGLPSAFYSILFVALCTLKIYILSASWIYTTDQPPLLPQYSCLLFLQTCTLLSSDFWTAHSVGMIDIIQKSKAYMRFLYWLQLFTLFCSTFYWK